MTTLNKLITTIKSYANLIIGGAVLCFLVWSHWTAHNIGADGVRLDVAKQALKQIERAQDETRTMQEVANAAQEKHTRAQVDIGQRDDRIRNLLGRMLNTPSTEQLANLTAATLSTYAADIDRDFAECRDEYAALGTTAAKASAAAWAHREAWPTLSRESINQDRAELRKE